MQPIKRLRARAFSVVPEAFSGLGPTSPSGLRLNCGKPKREPNGGLDRQKLGLEIFSFLYLKKIKISKIYVRFEIFQKYPQSPPIGRQSLNVFFFLQICNEVPGRGRARARGACRPPTGDRGACCPPLGRPVGPVHRRDRGACRPPPLATGSFPSI